MEQKPLSFYATLPEQNLFENLKTSKSGLSHEEAEKRLRIYGRNVFVTQKKQHPLIEFIKNFRNPLVIILLFAAGASLVVGQAIDSFIIAVIVLLSVLLNFFQEYSANKAAQKLEEKVATTATVVRNNEKKEIRSSAVVVGDIVVLSAGDLLPADVRILQAHDFFINESPITGESFPVEKTNEPVQSEGKSESSNDTIGFGGSSVVSGEAVGVVVATGSRTQIGQIGVSIGKKDPQTAFAKGVGDFSILILRITIVFVVCIFFLNAFFKHNILESFTFAVAIAVGLTPELLPVIMSVTMSRGSLKMAKKGAIVKKLSAIPNFGSMDVLCTDKTGTLTEGEIKVVKYVDIYGKLSEKVLQFAYVNSFFQTAVKNPLDQALLTFKREDISDFKKIDEIPFDFLRRRVSVIASFDKKKYLISKGATEEMFAACSFHHNAGERKSFTENDKAKSLALYKELSKDGYRVLAVAYKELSSPVKTYSKKDEEDLTLLGFIAFLDEAKKDVKEVLARIEGMGVTIKIITGDNELVTKKICDDVGLVIKGILIGREVSSMSDAELKEKVGSTTIFAGITPADKTRIIKALQASGHVVGYLGDGINDAPSLKAADVGISVQNATDIAKTEAEIILTHKSLKELEDGILEGRKTFGNTMKYIMMGISSNFGNMFSVLAAVFFLPFLPMLPVQILLNNFLYDVSQVTIPSDSVDKSYTQKPRHWDIRFIRNFMFTFGPISSLFDFLTFYVLFTVFKSRAGVFQTGWFLESLATQTLAIYIIRTRQIPFLQSRPSKYLLLTTLAVVAFGWILPFTTVGNFFGFTPLPARLLLVLVAITVVYLITIEIAKRIFYRMYAV